MMLFAPRIRTSGRRLNLTFYLEDPHSADPPCAEASRVAVRADLRIQHSVDGWNWKTIAILCPPHRDEPGAAAGVHDAYEDPDGPHPLVFPWFDIPEDLPSGYLRVMACAMEPPSPAPIHREPKS